MSHTDLLRQALQESARVKSSVADDPSTIEALADVAQVLVQSLRDGGAVFFCGNGGSATDAEHLSAELLGHFRYDRPSIAGQCLSSNTAGMTAIGNDYGYETVFSRQLQGLAKAGDVLIGMSTSGNSLNVVRAIEQAAVMGVISVAFVGSAGGEMARVANYVFRAPSDDTPRVQECHMTVGHTLCEIVESELHPRA